MLRDLDKEVFVDWQAGIPPGTYESFVLPCGDGFKKFVLVRHGCTKMNKEAGSGDSAERIRGWADVPLDAQGKQDAKRLAEDFKNVDHIDCIYASDLSRAADTAKAIGEAIGIKVELTDGLRPWNVGEHTGASAKTAGPILADLALHHPDQKIPKGESFNEFAERAMDCITEILEEHKDEHIMIVTHHRVERLVAAWEDKALEDREIAPQKPKSTTVSYHASTTET